VAVTKSEFVDRVASKSGLSKRDAARAVDTVIEVIEDALSRGDAVTFTGFGKFAVQQRKARSGVNPRTGEKVEIPAARVPKFTAGSGLKAAVR
jgi:DNA-binding protein HU-beta